MIETDLLVIGSGFAGLWAAITAKDSGVENVALVDKGAIGMSSQMGGFEISESKKA